MYLGDRLHLECMRRLLDQYLRRPKECLGPQSSLSLSIPPLRALACRRTFITYSLSFHYNDDCFIFYRLARPHHVRKGFLPRRPSVSRMSMSSPCYR
jgi:hypothetical protein